jgi:diaminohydroxyphosphoribosylaminopyrimidine deaminase/5-amino-6-(5-phosphoribosylamino)uracil reductase
MLDSSNVAALFARVLTLARKGWGDTHPNPMVGALIVEGGEIVAEGFHARAGSAHAEVAAFSTLGRKPREGATLFVSLEPCSTHGRTLPCTDAIVESGIKQVFVGCLDPNPDHSNRGLEILRKSGVSVELAPQNFQSRTTRLNFIFNHHITTGKALVALKLAESMNGMVAEKRGEASRVTGEDARADVMKWRRLFPSICVGAGTVLTDDPQLTVRTDGQSWCSRRIIVDSSLSTLSPDLSLRKVYSDEYRDRTVILTTNCNRGKEARVERAKELGLKLIQVNQDDRGRVPFSTLSSVISDLGLSALYCEGGPCLARSLLSAGQIDYLFHYQSPKIFQQVDAVPGPGLERLNLREPIKETLGEDLLRHGFL